MDFIEKKNRMNDFFGYPHATMSSSPSPPQPHPNAPASNSIAPLPFDSTLGYLANNIDLSRGVVAPGNNLQNPIQTANPHSGLFDVNASVTKIAEVAPTPSYVLKQVERKKEEELAKRAEEMLQKQQEAYNNMWQPYDANSIQNHFPDLGVEMQSEESEAAMPYASYDRPASFLPPPPQQQPPRAANSFFNTQEDPFDYDPPYEPEDHFEYSRPKYSSSSAHTSSEVLDIIQSLQSGSFAVFPSSENNFSNSLTSLSPPSSSSANLNLNHRWQDRNPFISQEIRMMQQQQEESPPTSLESNSVPATTTEFKTAAESADPPLSEAQKLRRQFFRYVTPDNQDAAHQLWKEGKQLEKREGHKFNWEEGPNVVFEQVTDVTRDREAEKYFDRVKKDYFRKAFVADAAACFLIKKRNFSVKRIVENTLKENKDAIKQEYAERPPPPPTIPTRAILGDIAWETAQQLVDSIDPAESEESKGRMARMSSSARHEEDEDDMSIVAQWAKKGFGYIKQWFGVKTRPRSTELEEEVSGSSRFPPSQPMPPPPPPPSSAPVFNLDEILKQTEAVQEEFAQAVQFSRGQTPTEERKRSPSSPASSSSLGPIEGLKDDNDKNSEKFDAIINTSELLGRRQFPSLTIDPNSASGSAPMGSVLVMMDPMMKQFLQVAGIEDEVVQERRSSSEKEEGPAYSPSDGEGKFDFSDMRNHRNIHSDG